MNKPKFCKCGSPVCGYCGKCIMEKHPKRPDGSVVEYGTDCPEHKK